MTNPYFGKVCLITTPIPGADGRYGNGFIAPADGSLPARQIQGCEIGSCYDLIAEDGSVVDGPVVVQSEIDEFIAKRGGEVGRVNGGDVAPYPGWTAEQFVTPLASPVTIGAHGPEALRIQPLPEVPDTPVPLAEQPAGEVPPVTLSTVAVGDPLPADHVAVHAGVVAELDRLFDDAKRGVSGAFAALEAAYHHAFHHSSP